MSSLPCARCHNDMVSHRTLAQDAMDLPQGVPAAHVKDYPAEVHMFACIGCEREEAFVRGPSGRLQFARVWPHGRWCEVQIP